MAATRLPQALQRFVLHWGDMGQSWGVSRSVAQIHALLFVSGRPLNAEEITEALQLARIVAIRKAREIDPAAEVLKSCLAGAAEDPAATPGAVRRLSR